MISEIFQEVRYQTILKKNSPLPHSQPTKLSIPEATNRGTGRLNVVDEVVPADNAIAGVQVAAPGGVIVVLDSTPEISEISNTRKTTIKTTKTTWES